MKEIAPNEIAISEEAFNAMMQNTINASTARLREENEKLKAALQVLYNETADYIKRNRLGDVHHNLSMQRARDALGYAESVSTLAG